MGAALRLATFGLAALPLLSLADDPDDFSNYLVDVGAGHVTAGTLLKLGASAIVPLEAPKDFVAAFNALDSGSSQKGAGLSITPSRTSLAPVSIADYKTRTAARIWGGTSFSYAKNTRTLGDVDYKQDAVAVQVNYYLKADDDPHVAAYTAFANCDARRALNRDTSAELMAELKAIPPDVLADPVKRANAEKKIREDAQLRQVGYRAALTSIARQCARDASAPKWNATQFALSLGQAWIRSPDAGAPRLSLTRTLGLSAVYGPSEQTLLNLTLRRSDRAIDLDTLKGTPQYRRSTLAAARLTYGAGSERDLYGLVEVSNAKSTIATEPNTGFKYALGIDKRIAEGAWLEFRVGKRRSFDSGSMETVSLLNLKLSPTTSLPKAQAK